MRDGRSIDLSGIPLGRDWWFVAIALLNNQPKLASGSSATLEFKRRSAAFRPNIRAISTPRRGDGRRISNVAYVKV